MKLERDFFVALVTATVENNFPEVQSLLTEYALKNDGMNAEEIISQFKDGNKRSILHFAAQSQPKESGDDDTDIVLMLISSGLVQNRTLGNLLKLKDVDGMTPLMLAAQNFSSFISNVKLAKRRIDAIIEVGSSKLALARSDAGAAPLHYAAGSAAPPVILDTLYECGKVALKTSTKSVGYPLHWAANSPSETAAIVTVTHLIKLLEDSDMMDLIDARNNRDVTPLYLAAVSGNDRVAEVLVKAGADRTIVLPMGGASIYHIAADSNLVKTLTALLEADARDGSGEGAKRQLAKAESGETPLDLAAKQGHVECVRLLLSDGGTDDRKAKEFIEKRQENNESSVRTGTSTLDKPKQKSDAIEKKKESEFQMKGKSIASAVASKIVDADDKEKATTFKLEGNSFFAKKEYLRAIECYTAATASDPTDATFYSNRSACYLNLDQYEKALIDGYVARELKPEWARAYYRIAQALFKMGEYVEAADAAYEGIKDTDNDELQVLLKKCISRGRKEHFANQAKAKKEESAKSFCDLKEDT